MQQFWWKFINANPNFHMQICLSQQSLSPSHHFLHSNAFSPLYKILSATRRGCARFVRMHFAIPAHLPCHMRRCTLDTVFCMHCFARFITRSHWRQYKMNAPGDPFFLFLLSGASRCIFNRSQSVFLKALSDGWER